MQLFHFLPSCYALQNLSARRLKVAEYSNLNDPFELIAADNKDPRHRSSLHHWKQQFQASWGILCFCRMWRNPLMWSHYADKHRGMCLGFEVFDSDAIPVSYSQRRLKIDATRIDPIEGFVSKKKNQLIRTKYSGWSYEEEVRVLIKLQDAQSDRELRFWPFSARLRLTDVFVGPLSTVSKQKIEKAIAGMDDLIKIHKTRLAFKEFRVVIDKSGFA